jgi:hypothetical protein
MKILSFDIGTKNLAYCILEFDTEKKQLVNIGSWEVINLYDNDNEMQIHNRKCSHYNQKKKIKCIRSSVNYFFDNYPVNESDTSNFLNSPLYVIDDYIRREVCVIHKKQLDKDNPNICYYPYDNKNLKCINLLLKKRENKEYLCNKNAKYLHYDKIGRKQSYCNGCLNKLTLDTQFEKIVKKKTLDDEIIYNKIFDKFNNRPQFTEVDEIIIENQPALKNPKMKSIQMFVYSYFFIRSRIPNAYPNLKKILFFSAFTKFDSIFENTKPKELDNYKDRKKQAIFLTKKLIDDNWNDFLSKNPKKDDLADSFIQGLTFIVKKYGVKVKWTGDDNEQLDQNTEDTEIQTKSE